ncbi:MAG: hypothetical protein PQJ28_00710, partial [Spirochaetales bacterium]|nr:hypothetical protein [Spirochaetales bacterium]
MKKLIIMPLLCVLLVAASAQAATSFSKNSFKDFTLHTYVSDDPLGDVSFIIESKNKLVILEPQAFNKNLTELNEYAAKLNKPLAAV